MKHNPISDVVEFLLQPALTTGVFWVLLLCSIAIAVYVFGRIPGQRTAGHIGNWIFRLLIGCIWWQQTLWKLPPFYTDHPDQPFGETGLAYWMTEMGKSAAVSLQADLVNNLVLPHFYVFALIVYSLEVLTAVSLMLRLFVGLWGAIGALQILNLWLGLYHEQGEWPWTYFFLMVIQLILSLHHYGRSLGLDTLVADRWRGHRDVAGILASEAT